MIYENISDLLFMLDDKKAIEILFTRKKQREKNKERYQSFEKCFLSVAIKILDEIPNRHERILALIKLQECMFYCFAAIDRDHDTNNYLQARKMRHELFELKRQRGDIL